MRNKNMRVMKNHHQDRIKPSEPLVQYMREKSQLEKKKQKARSGLIALSPEEQSRLESIRNNKKRVLENIIFPSLANLIFFFESVNQEEILAKTFRNDILDLLGIRRNNPNYSNYGIFFWRLVAAIVAINSKPVSNDFRLKLMAVMHGVLWKKMEPMLGNILYTDKAIRNVSFDMDRAITWTDMISSNVQDHYDYGELSKFREASSKIEKDEKKAEEIALKQFENYLKSEAPDRTLDFDTKQILEKDII
jgi:hypothetical protein